MVILIVLIIDLDNYDDNYDFADDDKYRVFEHYLKSLTEQRLLQTIKNR